MMRALDSCPQLQSSVHDASRVLASGGMNYDAGCFLIKMAMPTTKNPAPVVQKLSKLQRGLFHKYNNTGPVAITTLS
jgi:hypothetical protein